MANPDQPLPSRSVEESVEIIRDGRLREIDPADDALDVVRGCSDLKEFAGFRGVRHGLHEHRAGHAEPFQLAAKVRRTERTPDGIQGIALHPRVAVARRVPEVMVRIDHVGSGALSRINPSLLRSDHSSAGMSISKSFRFVSNSGIERGPSSTEHTCV